ncbi:MAG: LysR family transcriptional regulator [Pseudomonadota bacterium]
MDLRQLRYFLAVATTGSFTKAAEQIPLAQSALSRHMRLLEEELGATLLIRTGRGVELTEQGKFLVERARTLVEQSEDTKRNLQSWNDNPAGLVRLGMTPTCTLTMAAPLLQRLHEKYENVSLQVSEGLSASLSEWLGDGRLDMAIVFTEPKGVIGECERIAREELCLVVPAGSSCPNPATIQDMAGMPIIAPFLKKGIRNRMTDAYKDCGLEFTPAFEIDALPAMKDLVRSGAGAAILSKSSVTRELESGEVELRRIDAKNMFFHVYLLMSKSALHSRAAQGVAEIVRQTSREIFVDN